MHTGRWCCQQRRRVGRSAVSSLDRKNRRFLVGDDPSTRATLRHDPHNVTRLDSPSKVTAEASPRRGSPMVTLTSVEKRQRSPLRDSTLAPIVDRARSGVGKHFPSTCPKRRGEFGMASECRDSRRERLDHCGILASIRDHRHQIGVRRWLPMDATCHHIVPVLKGPSKHGVGSPRSPFHHGSTDFKNGAADV